MLENVNKFIVEDVLLRIVSHLQDLRPNNFNIAGLNNDWNWQLFLYMKQRGMFIDKLHFASEFTLSFPINHFSLQLQLKTLKPKVCTNTLEPKWR
jgi:hypothetical protein